MSTAPAATDISTMAADPEKIALVMKRLDGQIQYHEAKSATSQRHYKRIKGTEIVAAALIPFLAALHVADNLASVRITLAVTTALLGVLITILEGILQLNQYQQLWITCRSACEALNHEKYLYFAKAGDYAKSDEPVVLLAERIEAIALQENARWASLLQQQKEAKSGT